MPRPRPLPVVFRLYNREAVALLPASPWDATHMGAFTPARGFFPAPPDAPARGRPLDPEAAKVLGEALAARLGEGVRLVPLLRVAATVHEARLRYAKELLGLEEGK